MPVAYQDYYEALEVSRDASQDEIRQAYRRLARRFHPDVEQGARRRGPLQADLRGLRGPARPREARALRSPRLQLESRPGRLGRPAGSARDSTPGTGSTTCASSSAAATSATSSRASSRRRAESRRASALRGVLDARRRLRGGARPGPRGGGSRRQAVAVARRRALGRGRYPARRARRGANPRARPGRRRGWRRSGRATWSCGSGSGPIPASGSTAATCTSISQYRHGRRRSAPRSRCRRSTAPRGSRFRRGHPAVGGCGSAARGCPAAGERRPATCTRSSRSGCRRS